MEGKGKRAPNKGTFVKGDPRAGRPKGVPNKATLELKELIDELLTPVGWRRLNEQWEAGTLPAATFHRLLDHRYGVPKQTVGVEAGPGVTFTLDLGKHGDSDSE
jgi:hypothetical protein